jgi:hypothetical protein
MKIISPNNPVIVQHLNQSTSNACGCQDSYSNGDGDTVGTLTPRKPKPIESTPTQSGESAQTTGRGKSGINADLLSAGTDIFTQLGTALIGRQRTYTDVEQKCGKKPKVGKKAIEAWNKCASSADLTPTGAPTYTTDENKPPVKEPMKLGVKIGIAVGGLAVVGLVIFLVMKSGKK